LKAKNVMIIKKNLKMQKKKETINDFFD